MKFLSLFGSWIKQNENTAIFGQKLDQTLRRIFKVSTIFLRIVSTETSLFWIWPLITFGQLKSAETIWGNTVCILSKRRSTNCALVLQKLETRNYFPMDYSFSRKQGIVLLFKKSAKNLSETCVGWEQQHISFSTPNIVNFF